ncbi:DedD protein [Orbus hercynius]|uniref:DedD protein n=1 Tax=Orbus hercynius TaxID=593135 RepID=A0A495RBE4_9GAMM|nr:SPOR domain-containing protein [Orbus hercynius]RKS84735.1 DedD protein [Orbus hercynius]
MDNQKRNRLIGFITLILLALLVSPYVLVDKSKQIEATIPILPSNHQIESALVEDNDDLDIETSSSLNELANEVNSVVQQQIPANNSIQDSSSAQTEKNYVVQLVALKNKQKIEELIALLRLNNYDVYTLPAVPQEGQLTRLFVGQYLTKAQAEMVIIDLEHLSKLKGFVTTK